MSKNIDPDIKFNNNEQFDETKMSILDSSCCDKGYAAEHAALEDNPYNPYTEEKQWVSWRYGWLMAFFIAITGMMDEEDLMDI